MINWIYYPNSDDPGEFTRRIVKAFEDVEEEIDSSTHKTQHSNQVLASVRSGLERLGFVVESGKGHADKISVPVLFGINGKVEKSFDADAHHAGEGWVIEVEAGRAYTNYQFLKDLFQACMMHDVKYLGIAVRNDYRGRDDFSKIKYFFDTLYVSGRLKLPLTGVLLIGY